MTGQSVHSPCKAKRCRPRSAPSPLLPAVSNSRVVSGLRTGVVSPAMPTEPQPLSLADLARRAVQICDPDDTDAVRGDYLTKLEDAAEPVTAIQNLEERVALAAEGVDADVADPSIAVANAVILYLAHRRDEMDDDPEVILRLTARAEWQGSPPEAVADWLADRGVRV